MALIHKADIVPSKLELLAGWLPKQTWFAADEATELARIAAFRFDDPAGQVGVETLLIRSGSSPLFQVPLTYRNDEVPGASRFLIGTFEHSVLGTRWVYDAAGDPVYLGELALAALTGGSQVDQSWEVDGVRTFKDLDATVTGSGAPGTVIPDIHDDHVPATRNDRSSTLVETDHFAFLIARQPIARPLASDTAAQTLTGGWADASDPDGPSTPAILALVSLRG
jgi:hypothetical protein